MNSRAVRRSLVVRRLARLGRPAWLLGLAAGCLLAILALPGAERQTAAAQSGVDGGRPIKVLFLGQVKGPSHDPETMFPHLAQPLARRGIQLTYVATPEEALDPAILQYYDALMIYGNHDRITPDQEQALLSFVEGGKGLVAIHSASAEFTNSEKYIALVGAQFQRHGTGEFTAEIVQPDHPVMKGLHPFETWDETYVHTKHNPQNRTVLMERVDANGREPYTWVRTQGQGRVFYTAYGHDVRTWSKPEFAALIENGVSWVVPEPARQARERLHLPDVVYVDGYNVPNYEQRDPAPKFQLPFTPADAMKFMQAPAEFDVQLFASEPDVIKPIAMAFDERGRLWVIEAHDYPNQVLNGNAGDDVIKILEDTDHDGRADKFTEFATGINLATSLVFANGGVIVSAAPHFFFLKDTDGDDRADVKTILSTGWGTRDTHAVASTLLYGPDNYVYGVVGYSGYDGTMNGTPMQFGQGAYRFRPDGSGFEYLTRSTNNTWGLGFNESFDIFGSTANGDPSWYLGIPNRFFEGVEGLTNGPAGRGAGPGYQSIAQFTAVHYTTPYIRQVDNMDAYTAGAGHQFYTARQFPKKYWNRVAFINEPTVHITGQAVVEPLGAGYVARDGWNLISSAEEWFAPVSSIVGPDGAVWVADWYNFIAQHNPTPEGYSVGMGAAYETSMRDHERGRIYRIVYKGAKAEPVPSLSKNDPAGLVAALTSDNMFWRLTAQRLLVERGEKDVVPQLIALTRDTAVDAVGINGGAMHALWTLHGLGELATTTTDAYRAAVDALRHPAANVRKAAAMVLPKTPAAADALLASGALEDSDLHTRLAVALVLAEMPSSPAVAQAVYKASQQESNYTDPWLGRALYIAATRQGQGFLEAYRNDPQALPFSGLSVPLRLGNLTPDWRQPSAEELASDWTDVRLPGNWEANGLPGFDGTVWYTRTVELSGDALPDTISLGPVRNNAQVWVNGVEVSPQFGGGRGRGQAPPRPGEPLRPTAAAVTAELVYPVPAGTLHTGANTISVRVTNPRAEGGFIGSPAQMYLSGGARRTPLAGPWKYRVERSANTGMLYHKPGELAAHVAFTASGGAGSSAAAALPTERAVPDVVLQLGVVPNEMQYTTKELTVQAGQLVEIVFTNNDQMQHNVVIGAPGALESIGAAADQLATQPGAASVGYVPDVAQVLVKTPLVDPGQSLTFQFRAPSEAGQYPYLCTFPAHWRLMNGVLNVTEPARGRGFGGRRGGGAADGGRGAGAGAGARGAAGGGRGQ